MRKAGLNARTATAADFDLAAERHAHAFWVCFLAGAVVHWLAGLGWAIALYVLAGFLFTQFCGAAVMAHRTRKREIEASGAKPLKGGDA